MICFYLYLPPFNSCPSKFLFFLIVGEERGKVYWGLCGEGRAGGGGIKYYFYCHSLFPLLFFWHLDCLCQCNRLVHTKQAFVLSVRENGLSHILSWSGGHSWPLSICSQPRSHCTQPLSSITLVLVLVISSRGIHHPAL